MDEELKKCLIEFLNATKQQSPKIVENLAIQNSEYHSALATGNLIMFIIFVSTFCLALYIMYKLHKNPDDDVKCIGAAIMAIALIISTIGILVGLNKSIEHYAASKAPFGRVLEVTVK